MYVGCNVEQTFKTGTVHAEVNAISSMVASGRLGIMAVAVTANRRRFTPCGACMDWIFQFGGPDCIVVYQTSEGGKVKRHVARELMPHYPE